MKRITTYSKVERIIYTLSESDIRDIILKHLELVQCLPERMVDVEFVEVDGGGMGSSTEAIVTVSFEKDDEKKT